MKNISNMIPFFAGWLLGTKSNSISGLISALVIGLILSIIFGKIFGKKNIEPQKIYLQKYD